MPAQKFALKDATVLSTLARDEFCESKYCGGYDCPYLHDEQLRKRLRAIALRLAQRGYGPTKRQRGGPVARAGEPTGR